MNNATVSVSRGGLFSKVALLLTGSMCLSALGTYVGAGITSLAAIIALAIAFLAGAFIVPLAAKSSKEAGLVALAGWTFISGLFLGPTINHYVAVLGWSTVFLSFLGTGGVMAACGAIGALSGRDFSKMGWWLTIALLGLIVVGIFNIFVAFSTGVEIVYCLIGIAIFAGFFIFDFFRLSKADDNWFNAITGTMEIYLDFINVLLYLLRLIAALTGKRD
ncbi:MAG: Bax inhibitor-1/YccA family protein [Leptolyngbya sp.]|nr:Bax inhibitor-1/YccA family protein [Candidatus Melainabacteria bacterium]